jgi:Fic family protein
MIYKVPKLPQGVLDDLAAFDLAHDRVQAELAGAQQHRPLWQITLRRLLEAEALRGSTTVEGFAASLQQALDIVDGRGPDGMFEADRDALEDYARAMKWILSKADDPDFAWTGETIRNLHFLIVASAPEALPARFKTRENEVNRPGGEPYRPAPAAAAPALVAELCAWLTETDAGNLHPLVVSSMAHLNILSIHPFRDGNGRLARALASLVLLRKGFARPEYVSLEQHAGRYTQSYYGSLMEAQGSSFEPTRSALPFVAWAVKAHRWQAEAVLERAAENRVRWLRCLELSRDRNLPERVVAALFNASVGEALRNQTYRALTSVSPPTAVGDLRGLVQAGLLRVEGSGRETRYLAAEGLLSQVRPERKEDRMPLDYWRSEADRLAQLVAG